MTTNNTKMEQKINWWKVASIILLAIVLIEISFLEYKSRLDDSNDFIEREGVKFYKKDIKYLSENTNQSSFDFCNMEKNVCIRVIKEKE